MQNRNNPGGWLKMYALGPIRGGIGIRLAFKALTAQALNTSYGVGGVFAEQTPQEEGRDEDESRGAVRGQGRGKISWRPMGRCSTCLVR